MAKTILVLNGPNLEVPGNLEPAPDGQTSLTDVEKACRDTAGRYDLAADCRQSDSEDELIDFIREAQAGSMAGIVINAGDYSRVSKALHDALAAGAVPSVEVHITNTGARASLRHHAFPGKAAFATVSGFGIDGYRLAISGLAAKIGVKAAA